MGQYKRKTNNCQNHMEFVQEYQLIFADPTLAEKTAKVGPKQADTHDAGRPRQPDPQEPLGDVALRLTAPLTRRTPVMFPIPPYTGQDPAAGWPSSTPAPGGSIEPVPRWPWPEDRVSLSHAARRAGGEQTLSPEEQRQIDDLKQRDQEVKAHERAHMAAGAGLVSGGASYEYQRGPDGKMYAVGGEVQIDVSAENDPDATIRKMQQVRRAAMAPAQPSRGGSVRGRPGPPARNAGPGPEAAGAEVGGILRRTARPPSHRRRGRPGFGRRPPERTRSSGLSPNRHPGLKHLVARQPIAWQGRPGSETPKVYDTTFRIVMRPFNADIEWRTT
jgi:hypothetical protein